MSDQAERYRAQGYWTDRLLTDFFESAVEATPKKIFIKDDRHGAFTYGELSPVVLKLATILQQNGIRRGDRFVIALPNWYHVAVFALALNYLGVICVHMPATGGVHEFSGVLKVSEAKGIVTPRAFGSSDFIAMINSLADMLDSLVLCIAVGEDPQDPRWLRYDALMS